MHEGVIELKTTKERKTLETHAYPQQKENYGKETCQNLLELREKKNDKEKKKNRETKAMGKKQRKNVAHAKLDVANRKSPQTNQQGGKNIIKNNNSTKFTSSLG